MQSFYFRKISNKLFLQRSYFHFEWITHRLSIGSFLFDNDKLAAIYEITTTTDAPDAGRIILLRNSAVKYMDMTLIGGYIPTLSDNSERPLSLDDTTDKATIESLSDKIAAHEVAIFYILRNETAEMCIMLTRNSDGEDICYTRDYTERD